MLSIQGTNTCVHVSELFNIYTTRARWAAAAVFHMAHLAAITAALAGMVELTAEGLVFEAPRRRAPAARASMAKTPKAKRPRAPALVEATLEGAEFEEGGVDWKAPAVV